MSTAAFVRCPRCVGDGKLTADGPGRCPYCGGWGKVGRRQASAWGGMMSAARPKGQAAKAQRARGPRSAKEAH